MAGFVSYDFSVVEVDNGDPRLGQPPEPNVGAPVLDPTVDPHIGIEALSVGNVIEINPLVLMHTCCVKQLLIDSARPFII